MSNFKTPKTTNIYRTTKSGTSHTTRTKMGNTTFTDTLKNGKVKHTTSTSQKFGNTRITSSLSGGKRTTTRTTKSGGILSIFKW